MRRIASRELASHAKLGLLALLVVCSGCTDPWDLPTTGVNPTAPEPEPEPTPAFPPLAGPGRVYGYLESLVGWGFPASNTRYVLYDDSTFAVQWTRPRGVVTASEARSPRPAWEERPDGVILFRFDSERTATGTLSGDTLRVRYNGWMALEDWQDAAYLLDRSAGPKPTGPRSPDGLRSPTTSGGSRP